MFENNEFVICSNKNRIKTTELVLIGFLLSKVNNQDLLKGDFLYTQTPK